MEVKTVGVYGAGLMGRGIAQVALEGGYDVVLYNHRTPTLEKGVAGIQKGFDKKMPFMRRCGCPRRCWAA